MKKVVENYGHKYSKRRKLNNGCKFCKDQKEFTSHKKKLNISHLPSDIVENIFEWIPASFLIKNVRVLSKYFECEVSNYLNNKFCCLHERLMKVEDFVVMETGKAKTEKIRIELNSVHNCIKLVINQYKLAEAVIWRYLKQKECEFIFCLCGGRMMENFDNMILRVHTEISREFTDIMLEICEAAKNFTVHFERFKELKLNTDCFVSGAKICDILDCHAFADRKIIQENYEHGIVSLKISYKLCWAWFSVLDVSSSNTNKNKMSWQKEQILMYMRMRHFVLAHTGINLALLEEKFTQEQEFDPDESRELLAFGCGGLEDEYFYYGCCNQATYNKNVTILEGRYPNNDESSEKFLEIIVDLICPLEQAPLFVYKQHFMRLEGYKKLLKLRNTEEIRRSCFKMEIRFICELSKEARLPWRYVYVVSDEDSKKRSGIIEDEEDIVYDMFQV